MPHTKTVRSNKKIKSAVKIPTKTSAKVIVTGTSEDMEELVPAVSNIKKLPDVDLHDDIIGVIEEKPEVDPLLSEEEADELAAEESGLDDEEINPFGDKWEV